METPRPQDPTIAAAAAPGATPEDSDPVLQVGRELLAAGPQDRAALLWHLAIEVPYEQACQRLGPGHAPGPGSREQGARLVAEDVITQATQAGQWVVLPDGRIGLPVPAAAPPGPVPAALTGEESARLAQLEAVIERGLQTFLEVGLALVEVRRGRLYRGTHPTFEAYCEDRLGFTGRRARQLIAAAETVASLPTGTVVPANEAQARELDGLPPAVAADVVARAARRHGRLTARGLRDARREIAQDTPPKDVGPGQPDGPRVPSEEDAGQGVTADQRRRDAAVGEIERRLDQAAEDTRAAVGQARDLAGRRITLTPEQAGRIRARLDEAARLAATLAGILDRMDPR